MTSKSSGTVSRRSVLKRGAAVAGGAALLGGRETVAAQAAAQAGGIPGPRQTNLVGAKFRAFVRHGTTSSLEELTLLPIQPREVVVRTQATPVCYTHIVTLGFQQQGNVSFPAAQFANIGRTFHAGQQGGLNMMRDLPRFVKLIEKGLFDVKSMVTATYPLERTMEAIEAVAGRTTLGAVVTFS